VRKSLSIQSGEGGLPGISEKRRLFLGSQLDFIASFLFFRPRLRSLPVCGGAGRAISFFGAFGGAILLEIRFAFTERSFHVLCHLLQICAP
jgi:hypothetical protein